MDFSRSRDVAMFFATCAYNASTGTYAPLRSGTAVIYTADLQKLIFDGCRLDMLPLGGDPLPRPMAQRAFALPLGPDENLETMRGITFEEFEITPPVSAKYFEQFEAGAVLFPNEPFDRHIDGVRRRRTYRPEALAAALERKVVPHHPGGIAGAMAQLEAAGYQACPNDIFALGESIEEAFAAWTVRREDIMNRLRFRGVAAHFQG
jgi:hypothetical protein